MRPGHDRLRHLALVRGGKRAGRDAADKAKIEAGETVYNNYCAVLSRRPAGEHGPDFRSAPIDRQRSREVRHSVRNGKNQMPPWKDVLSDDEIDQLWDYIRANGYEK